MTTSRIEAFSDGVIAIILTIMVLELKVPRDSSTAALLERWPIFLSYLLSFLVVAIMWVNHHHILHSARRVTAGLLWANIHLLFWMSLIPFVTAYMGETHGAPLAVAVYGGVFAFGSTAFVILRKVLAEHHLSDADLTSHHRRAQRKNLLSLLLYASSIPLAFVWMWASVAIFVVIPLLYFLPEARLEKVVE